MSMRRKFNQSVNLKTRRPPQSTVNVPKAMRSHTYRPPAAPKPTRRTSEPDLSSQDDVLVEEVSRPRGPPVSAPRLPSPSRLRPTASGVMDDDWDDYDFMPSTTMAPKAAASPKRPTQREPAPAPVRAKEAPKEEAPKREVRAAPKKKASGSWAETMRNQTALPAHPVSAVSAVSAVRAPERVAPHVLERGKTLAEEEKADVLVPSTPSTPPSTAATFKHSVTVQYSNGQGLDCRLRLLALLVTKTAVPMRDPLTQPELEYESDEESSMEEDDSILAPATLASPSPAVPRSSMGGDSPVTSPSLPLAGSIQPLSPMIEPHAQPSLFGAPSHMAPNMAMYNQPIMFGVATAEHPRRPDAGVEETMRSVGWTTDGSAPAPVLSMPEGQAPKSPSAHDQMRPLSPYQHGAMNSGYAGVPYPQQGFTMDNSAGYPPMMGMGDRGYGDEMGMGGMGMGGMGMGGMGMGMSYFQAGDGEHHGQDSYNMYGPSYTTHMPYQGGSPDFRGHE
ncbi:hypothetical protein KIPB_009580 [Kipferlia bialata]|uniref:Uncharacterized protein n=1 Tax=Kipferlia bialata TaxID=797122 RepID=A0A391NRM4_9EUKA|nr:hypothetical protein KIPB_009580 [Kipferlia bialata]|eukprot:g9580.t1